MKAKKNLDWLSASRGYAMYGVFLGHMLIAYINVGYDGLLTVGRFLEPIFVPFYLLIVGAFFSPVSGGLLTRIKFKALQRLLPALFYTLLVLPFLVSLTFHGRPLLASVKQLWIYFLGIPFFSWPMWFLIALFLAELVFQPLNSRITKNHYKGLLGVLLLSFGWLFNDWVNGWSKQLSYFSMFWQVHSLGLFLGFLFIGAAFKRQLLKLGKQSNMRVLMALLLSLTTLVVFVNLNSFQELPSGHVRERFISGMVFLSAGIYGQYFPYLLSVLAGAASLVFLSRLLPPFKVMQQVGEHALVLLGLNCLFHQIFNRYIALYVRPSDDALLWLWLWVIAVSFASLMLCLPLAIWLQKNVPQLVGKPMLKGPLLPAIYRAKR